jgi:hypothetical protein
LDRPSRFDRKYHFELPQVFERQKYITQWNVSLQPALSLSHTEIPLIVEAVAEFSFAYIKELFLSSMMRWIHHPEPGTMAQIMLTQSETLREQMRSAREDLALLRSSGFLG